MDTFGGNQSDDGKGSGPSSPENDVEDTMMEDDVENDDGSENEDKESDNENDDDDDDNDDNENADDADADNQDEATQQLQRERETSSDADLRWKPRIRLGAETATSYDIIPYVAAPMSTSIHAFCATPCMKLVFTGGQDGYIRKFDWFASINGKVPLTVAQKHPFVDSVTRAGVLLSYWENEEIPDKNSLSVEPDDIKISPVYSLATQSQALWLLSGLENGSINLQSVRHDEGKVVTVLRKHKSTVSVLTLGADEKSVLSGSWDRDLYEWDLNKGEVVRGYGPQAGQISAIQWRPQSIIPIPVERQPIMNGITSSALSKLTNGLTNGIKSPKREADADADADADAQGSPASSGGFDSLFGGDDVDADDLFGEELSNTRTAKNSTLALADGDDDVLMGDTQPAEQQLINENASVVAAAEASAENQSSETVGDINIDIPDTGESQGPENPRSPVNMNDLDANGSPDVSSNIFLAASIDGIVRVYDRRQEVPITRLLPGKGIPPWSTSACWGVDGNSVYVGRRNGTVEEYNIHKDFQNSVRTLKFPGGSGAVSYVTPMVNGRHLVCASFDNLRIYDLKDDDATRHSRVPFLIVPGHHGGVLSSVYIDPTSNYLLTMAGNRGWEGTSTEVMLGYEIVPM
ncbi:Transcription factor spt8 [Orbilia oligospora]|nr:Transcription factor spt8 [Orbilia oligospora]KAF3239781.1 Transcription factor spt8 [Orbilia oligospora]KAF3247982.1 Transcription factor spt8 [Orbilia oligospora]